MEYRYISVYSPDETNFEHNGLRILCPVSCTITEVLNGEYSLSIVHPLDEWGNWKFIRENYIIKAQGQLFRIYRKTVSMRAGGIYEVKADALHIFYDMNYCFIKRADVVFLNGPEAIKKILEMNFLNIGDYAPIKRFKFSSNLANGTSNIDNAPYLHYAHYEKISVTKALIGADNCFINVWGGELYRDNFYFAINKRRGKDDVFSIRYGLDMTEIECETDCSECCTTIYYEATVYNEQYDGETKTRKETMISGQASLDTLDGTKLPFKSMKYYSFERNFKDISRNVDGVLDSISQLPKNPATGDLYYISGEKMYLSYNGKNWVAETDKPDIYDIFAACNEHAKEYMLINCLPIINYRVKFADLKGYDLYKDFAGLQNCDIGDIGTVYHELLGISTKQQVVKKTIDGITGEVLSIELGSLRKSMTSGGKIRGGVNSTQAEMLQNEIYITNTWNNLGNLEYDMQSLNLSWNELAGKPNLISRPSPGSGSPPGIVNPPAIDM